MKINVGDYAYSKKSRDYGIGKIVKIHTNGFYHEEVEIQYKDIKISTRFDYVISSPNPIDLIQVGDYVNGSRVLLIKKDKERDTWTIVLENSKVLIGEHIISFRPIETIVTKEQFEKEMYVLESEVN